jgi:hypothetical protein
MNTDSIRVVASTDHPSGETHAANDPIYPRQTLSRERIDRGLSLTSVSRGRAASSAIEPLEDDYVLGGYAGI